MANPSAPGLFEGTAWYYSRFRFGYPPELFDFLIKKYTLSGSTPVLDLGCGTGQISIPLSKRGVPVVAVDPDVEMLAEGLRVEAKEGTHGIAWMRGNDEVLSSLHLPKLRLCTMGASFHWTKRDALLHELDRMNVEGVAVVDGGRVEWSGPNSDWTPIVKGVIAEFLGPERRAGAGTYAHPADRHETVLERSRFKNIERVSFKYARKVTIPEIIGLQLSMSFASPAQLGARTEDFKKVLSERLSQFNPTGEFLGEISTEVLAAAI